MSLGKEQMLTEEANRIREEKKVCGCGYNWEDKFPILCDRHAAEHQQAQLDNRNFYSLLMREGY